MPLRLLYFVVLYWERQWRAWEQAAAPKPPLRLSPVLPLVLHTDELLSSGDAWQETLAVLRVQGEEAAAFERVYVEAMRRLAPLAAQDHVRWYDLMRIILSRFATWSAWRPRTSKRGATSKSSAAANRRSPERAQRRHSPQVCACAKLVGAVQSILEPWVLIVCGWRQATRILQTPVRQTRPWPTGLGVVVDSCHNPFAN